jgi:Protein of unknwon function (DUF3310)
MTDKEINSPEHYQGNNIECIDAIKAMVGHYGFITYLQCSVMKYLWRFAAKGNPVQDLKKAEWFLQRLITEIETKDI